MSFTIPPNSPYPGPSYAIPSRETSEPAEDPQYIPLELDWSIAPFSQNSPPCTSVNIAQISTQPFSQLCMIEVDNTECSVDVQFLFPDTKMTKTVPAGTTARMAAPTSGLQFYIACVQAAIAGDITRVLLMNYYSRPEDIPKTEFTTALAAGSVSVTANGTTPILASGNGILAALVVSQVLVTAGASSGSANVQLQDGTGAVLANLVAGAPPSTQVPPTMIFAAAPYNVRFQNGLKIVVSGSNNLTNGVLVVNGAYTLVE